MSPKQVQGGAAEAAVHVRKADEFSSDAHAALDAGRFDAAVSAAAIAGVNASDAVTLARVGLRSASWSHSDALTLLQESGEPDMAVSLGTLLTFKNPAQYQERLFQESEAREAVDVAAAMVKRARSVVPEARTVAEATVPGGLRRRCGVRMPRAGVRCALVAGHAGPHRSH